MGEERDAVDRIVSEWSDVRPDLDVSGMAVVGRVSRLSRLLERQLAANFAQHGLEKEWMFDVLATLRRSGEPYELTAGDLVRRTMVTTGAMTNRIDRLAARGLVDRTASRDDRRVVLVRLTAEGLRVVDEAAGAHFQLEERLTSSLSSAERARLVDSLRSLLIALDDIDDTA